MSFPRASGILLHPTSLPGVDGIGDLGDEAYAFADYLKASGQRLWQVLPLGPTGYGDSPYQSYSAFAGNALLISLQRLAGDGLLKQADLAHAPKFNAERVDYDAASKWKMPLLRRAFEQFESHANGVLRDEFVSFQQQQASWLNDYTLFRALKDAYGGEAWDKWPQPLALRELQALIDARVRLREEIEAQKFYQFLFFRQWTALKRYCNEAGIKIVGDIPIFVAHDSADVWAQPHLFKLDGKGAPRVVAGVPPDYFSKTGQRWGNPLYDWERMASDGFQWWIARLAFTLRVVDIVRLDHFRGFAAAWEIPGEDATAERGRWVNAPGRELFIAVRHALGDVPLIAEDLGVMTPDVEALRDDFNFPGMRVLQFAFGGDSHSRDLPHNFTRNSVVYTGTHDNDTTRGWFDNLEATRRERQFCLDYFDTDDEQLHWGFIRSALASVADTAIIPLQDVLGLGADARMNLPATMGGNWSWRFKKEALTTQTRDRLKQMTELYGRGEG